MVNEMLRDSTYILDTLFRLYYHHGHIVEGIVPLSTQMKSLPHKRDAVRWGQKTLKDMQNMASTVNKLLSGNKAKSFSCRNTTFQYLKLAFKTSMTARNLPMYSSPHTLPLTPLPSHPSPRMAIKRPSTQPTIRAHP